jgi:hypothetical protein
MNTVRRGEKGGGRGSGWGEGGVPGRSRQHLGAARQRLHPHQQHEHGAQGVGVGAAGGVGWGVKMGGGGCVMAQPPDTWELPASRCIPINGMNTVRLPHSCCCGREGRLCRAQHSFACMAHRSGLCAFEHSSLLTSCPEPCRGSTPSPWTSATRYPKCIDLACTTPTFLTLFPCNANRPHTHLTMQP